MAEDNFTLTTFYTYWKEYQDHIKEALSPLTAEQLTLRATPGLRSIGEIAAHIIGCRAGWFTHILGEDWGADVEVYENWGTPGVPAPTAAELVQGLDYTWNHMAASIACWGSADMQKTFPDDWDGVIVELSRAWIIWHLLEHDVHHGGELSLTLGIHGFKAGFPG